MGAVLLGFHGRLGVALVLLAAVLGGWGSISFIVRRSVSGGFRSGYLLMAGMTAVQGTVGAGTFLAGPQPGHMLHVVYGIFAVIFLPGVYLYTSQSPRAREAALLAIACWVVAIAFLRGITTGR